MSFLAVDIYGKLVFSILKVIMCFKDSVRSFLLWNLIYVYVMLHYFIFLWSRSLVNSFFSKVSPQSKLKICFFPLLLFQNDASYFINGIRQILAVTVRFIQKDAEDKKTSFNPRPYFRLFINWLLDLSSLDPVIDGANIQV